MFCLTGEFLLLYVAPADAGLLLDGVPMLFAPASPEIGKTKYKLNNFSHRFKKDRGFGCQTTVREVCLLLRTNFRLKLA